MSSLKTSKNYLIKRGITAPWKIDPIPVKKFNQAIIIPSYGESDYLPQTLSSIGENDPVLLQRTLVVVVVNHGEDANDIYKTDNKKTLLFLSTSEYPFTLGVIDAASPGLELSTKKAGVGFARKIGLDLVLPHMTDKKSLLLSTDADTTVASHYLQTILNYFNQYDADAAVMGFCHMPPDNTNLEHAIKEYEEYLKGDQ